MGSMLYPTSFLTTILIITIGIVTRCLAMLHQARRKFRKLSNQGLVNLFSTIFEALGLSDLSFGSQCSLIAISLATWLRFHR